MAKKRKYIDWEDVILGIGDSDMLLKYHVFVGKHPGMSLSRCAYNVIKTFYSSTAIKYFRENGEWPL